MSTQERLSLLDVELRVCDRAAEQLGFSRSQVSPASRLIEDLGCDSLDLAELLMHLEEHFRVTLPNKSPNPVYKTVFTRQPFRLADLAELIYLQQGIDTPDCSRWRGPKVAPDSAPSVPFTQLDGVWREASSNTPLLEPLSPGGTQFRRRSDGMRCVLIPHGSVEIGRAAPDAHTDERPLHVVHLDAFLIDAEPVSTTAFCRFLNSVAPVTPEILTDWFLLDPHDDRNEHVAIAQVNHQWQPLPGAERWPMMLVSWFGANAYSLWANGLHWRHYRDESGTNGGSYLPTEAQWEYAARGARWKPFPWGDQAPTPDRARFGQHRRSATYRADTLPLADVNTELAMSPFGLHHMAGNVWQWCRDWYAEDFYQRSEARQANPHNRTPTQVRSERGGSWVGPAELCRSSYRRGRPPAARGRCLGFRCVSNISRLA